MIDNDPAQPNEAYFRDVDHVVAAAAGRGLFVGMLPTWGDKWFNEPGSDHPPIFNPDNARTYGRWLGERYSERPIIWILGGDRAIQSGRHRRIIEAMAAGLGEGDGGRHLKTYHPVGQYSSAIWFHDSDWPDFNMIQTGHTRDRDNYTSIAAEYARTPIKPVLDGEPGYENIPHSFTESLGRLDAHQARKFCYWSLFSGACGHTYGCNDIWQMWKTGSNSMVAANTPWDQAIGFPGSGQMRHARRLIESGPFFDRLPDASLIQPPNPSGADHVAACRGPDGRYALIYVPTGQPVTVRLWLLLGKKVGVRWHDPRTGESKPADAIDCGMWTTHTFTPPSVSDWVLVLQRIE